MASVQKVGGEKIEIGRKERKYINCKRTGAINRCISNVNGDKD